MLDMKKVVELINGLGIKTFTFDYSIYTNYILGCYQWYKGTTPYHVRKFYNGNSNVRVEKAKLHMGKRVSEDIASLVFNENVIINIEDKAEKEYLMGNDEMTGILGENDFWSMMSKSVELMAALGTAGVEVLVENLLQVENKFVPNKNTKIKIARYDALHILPLSYDNTGKIKEVAFLDEYQIKNETYLELRLHILNEKGNYVIVNKKCKVDYMNKDKNSLTNFIYMATDGIIEEFDTGNNIPWFTCIKMPQICSYDINSPMGASCYGDAGDVLKAIDDAFSTLCGEFRYSQKKVYYSKSLLQRDKNNNIVTPDEDDSTREIYYYTGDDMNEKEIKEPIHESNPEIRSKEISEGIELALDILSFKTGLGHGYYKFSNGTVQKTAKEVISANSDLYRNVCKMQLGIEKSLYEIIKALLYVSNYVFGTKYNINCKMSISFDQSLIEDKTSQRERALKEVELGLLTPDEYRAMYYPELGDKKEEAMQ